MTRSVGAAAAVICLVLASCSDSSADRNGDGAVNSEERAAEMSADAFIPMKPGRWQTKFSFTEIDVPTLGKAQKQQIMDEMAKGASSTSCLSEADAKRPGADFFGGEGADKCVYRSFDVSGQNVKMGLRCGMEGMGSVDMDLVGTMNESTFNFDTQMALRLPMIGKVKLKGTAIGQHAGACSGTE
jgi:hypothetical protein